MLGRIKTISDLKLRGLRRDEEESETTAYEPLAKKQYLHPHTKEPHAYIRIVLISFWLKTHGYIHLKRRVDPNISMVLYRTARVHCITSLQSGNNSC